MKDQVTFLYQHYVDCDVYECDHCDRFRQARAVLLEVLFPEADLYQVHQVFRVAGRR